VAPEECPEIAAPNTRELKGLLEAGEYEALEARLAAYDRAYAANVLCEPYVWKAYQYLGLREDDWIAKLDRWVDARPESAAAHVVRADALRDAGYWARGRKLARDTPPENFRRMREYFARAESDLAAAAELAPVHMVGVGTGTSIARAGGGREAAEARFEAYLERDPLNYGVREYLISAFEPRWGGSYQAMERVAEEAQEYVDRNPRLRVLLGFHQADIALSAYWDKEYDAAIDHYSKALAFGDYGTAWARGRAKAYLKIEKYDLALDDIEYAKLARPQDTDTFATGGWIRLEKGDYSGALEDLDRAIEISPNYAWAHSNRGLVHEHFGNWEQAAEDYRIALRQDPDSSWRTSRLARILLDKLDRPGEAVPLVRAALESEPGNRYRWFQLARAQEGSGDPGAAESYQRFLAMAEPNNPKDAAYAKIARRYLDPSLQASAAGVSDAGADPDRMPGLSLFMQ
jgi:tetratricopeptide (TPR) repeat protein